jgi:hypothetical protein
MEKSNKARKKFAAFQDEACIEVVSTKCIAEAFDSLGSL